MRGTSEGDLGAAEHDGQDQEVSFPYVVGRVNQGIRRAMRVRLSQCSLSVQEYTTLSVLAGRPGLSNAQLARRALVRPQSMIEILAKLERRQLVRREADPGHALILRAMLTEDGAELLARAEPEIAAIETEALAGVSAADRAAALRAMHAAMRNLSLRQGET